MRLLPFDYAIRNLGRSPLRLAMSVAGSLLAVRTEERRRARRVVVPRAPGRKRNGDCRAPRAHVGLDTGAQHHGRASDQE